MIAFVAVRDSNDGFRLTGDLFTTAPAIAEINRICAGCRKMPRVWRGGCFLFGSCRFRGSLRLSTGTEERAEPSGFCARGPVADAPNERRAQRCRQLAAQRPPHGKGRLSLFSSPVSGVRGAPAPAGARSDDAGAVDGALRRHSSGSAGVSHSAGTVVLTSPVLCAWVEFLAAAKARRTQHKRRILPSRFTRGTSHSQL